MIHDVAVREVGAKGLGVFALRDFGAGELIFRRRNARTVLRTQISQLPADQVQHLCELDEQRCALVLPPGCFLNHSCDPNAVRRGVNVLAWRDIEDGEELTLDYRICASGGDRWKCECAGPSCTGYVEGGFFSMSPERQRAFLVYAPPFIRREYKHRMEGRTAPKR